MARNLEWRTFASESSIFIMPIDGCVCSIWHTGRQKQQWIELSLGLGWLGSRFRWAIQPSVPATAAPLAALRRDELDSTHSSGIRVMEIEDHVAYDTGTKDNEKEPVCACASEHWVPSAAVFM
jgi:hypothetical protein